MDENLYKTNKDIIKEKPIEVFFEEYKKAYKLNNDDFGIDKPKPRTKEYVFNKAMFSKYAYALGYQQGQISSVLKVDRTTVLHYLNRYKDKNYVYEE